MPELVVDETKCTDCRICQLVCSARYTGSYRPALSRIQKGAGIIPDTTYTRVCRQCSDAPCVEACPVDALVMTDAGIVNLDLDLCTGCEACVDECPYDAIWVNDEDEKAFKCDLCGGKPECEERCPVEAISVR